jgi:hypothetical protein
MLRAGRDTFLSGVQFMIGMLGQHVARIFGEVRARPLRVPSS